MQISGQAFSQAVLALLGAGRRAATLRNRVRLLRNFFSWLTATHEVRYPTSLEHFVGFLRARASGPANRGALRNVNRTFTFLHEVTGTEQVDRLTATPLYDAVYKEILTSCEPGKPVKQAPRFPVGLLALVEDFVMTDRNPAYMRIQSWGTMRFSDHRGLSPADISFANGSLTGLLRRTKNHRHGQERVCEASESGRKFIHLNTPVALNGMADPLRAGPLQKGLSPSSASRSLRQLSSDRAQVRAGLRHPESTPGKVGR